MKDYSVLDGIKYNQECEIQRAFDKGYKQGYDEATGKYLEQVKEKEYKRGYEDGYIDGHKDGHELGRKEAWEVARKIIDEFSSDTLLEIFGNEKRLFEYSASEAIEMIKEYEDSQKNKKELKEKLQFLYDFCLNNKCSNCILHIDKFKCGFGGSWTETSYKYAGDVDKAIEIVKKHLEQDDFKFGNEVYKCLRYGKPRII